MKKLIATFLIVQFFAQVPSYAAFWHKDDLGNKIKQEVKMLSQKRMMSLL